MDDDAEKNIDELSKRLKMPVDSKCLSLEQTVVGPFFAFNSAVNNMSRETNAKKPTVLRSSHDLHSFDDLQNISDFAYQNGDTIVMREFNLSADMEKKLASVSDDARIEYLKGNPAALITAYLHEFVHYNRNHRGIAHLDYANGETNFALNYVDEKSAQVVEMLALVNIYNHCKEQNTEFFTYKDVSIKLDDLLKMYPNLEETVEKYGSDLSNPKTVTAIARVASETWDTKSRPFYEKKNFAEVAKENFASISSQIQGVKDGKKAMAAQLKDLDIGYGMKIDLPDECKDFIYPSKEYLHNYMVNSSVMHKEVHPSNEGLLAIDKYLEEKGITSAKAKDNYLKTQYEKIVNRASDADIELKDLLFAAEMDSSRPQTICYTDGLIEKRQGNKVLLSADKGKTFYELNNKENKTLLAQELLAQKGKYPPDAESLNDEVLRTMNSRKLAMNVNKTGTEQQIAENSSVEITKTTVNASIVGQTKELSH